jgi:hypothetical protein
MATSKSPEAEGWTAGASIFSGRRDPTWSVPAELGLRLERLWNQLPPWSGERPRPPPLGYRGCRLVAPDGREWTAFRELVVQADDARRDGEREFERQVIGSAPPEVLPPLSL